MKPIYLYLAIWVAITCVLPGCSSMMQIDENDTVGNALHGGAMGSAIGAGVGYAIGGVGGAAMGSAIGGMVGWGAVEHVHSSTKQIRTAQEDEKIYGFTEAADHPLVKIRSTAISPGKVKAGDTIKINMDYSLILPKGQKHAEVEEFWNISRDGNQLFKSSLQRFQRKAGGHGQNAELQLPSGASSGAYVIEHQVKADTSYDVKKTEFTVQ